MRRGAPTRRALAAATIVLALTACTAAGPPSPTAPSGSSPTAAQAQDVTPPRGTAGAAASAELAPEQWAAARQSAAEALVEDRFAAVGRGDRAAWLARLGGTSDASLRAAQSAVFDRMTRMGAGHFHVTALRETAAPVPAPRSEAVEWDQRVSLTYRLEGYDSAPRAFDLDLTFKADPAAPRRLLLTGSRWSGRPQPWDLEGLVVRRTRTSLVLVVGAPKRLDRVDEVVRRAQTAAARVAAVWGVARPAVWIAPATDADAAQLLGRTGDGLQGVAAATDGPLTPGRTAGADRIVLVPGAWTSLSPAGRDVVMTHELTHVTVRASTTRPVPVWLSEGFAELVAYEPVALPEATVVAPALAQVRSTGLPRALPADTDFQPGTGSLSAAYGLSLLALRTLADAYGTQAVVRVYREAAGGLDVPTARLDDPEAAVDEALRDVVHTSRPDLVTRWQARIRQLLR